MSDLNPSSQPASAPTSAPDYADLVRFLVQPFLDSPDLLRVDCEVSPRTMRVLVRLAFEGDDKGRVFGRGGRNIQAVRTVLQAVAQTVGQSAHLEVFGSQSSGSQSSCPREGSERPRSAPRRPQPRH
ncbi:MAG: KH domain-containing protein [Elainella sp.]